MNNAKTKKYASQKHKRWFTNSAIYVLLIVMSVLWVMPFVYLIAQSFATTYVYGDFFPKQVTWGNYARLFDFADTNQYPFWKWWVNTVLLSVVTSILQTILVLMTSYALSRLRFKARKPLMKFMLVLGMFPGFLGMVIIYYIFKLVGLETSIFSLILIYIGGSAMGYYISKGFFDTIPKSLDEAAMIDGANKHTVFFRVIMPLSKPIIIYTLLLGFVGPWGDYMTVSYIAQGNKDLYNVAVGLHQMLSKGLIEIYFPTFCAGGVLTAIPIMGLFFFIQKYYVEGVTGGAVKG